jgi:metallo-beta-lactamase class B
MKLKKIIHLIVLILLSISCNPNNIVGIYKTEELEIRKTSNNSFNHISYLEIESYGKIPCNGLVFIDNNEAIIFDTPTNKKATQELINWVEDSLKCRIVGIVATHFHVDCLGGLEEFHARMIPSYANKETLRLAQLRGFTVPQNGFDGRLELKVGQKSVINEFLGEGHSLDNIVSYVPSEQVLFGGCLIKAIGGGKGNLKDANVNEWSNTVRKVKDKFGDAKIIIPGHGKYGGIELLDFTIEKFKVE